MAESEKKDEGSGESWWGSWIQAAKDTSASAMEFVRRDLGEFTCTVQADTQHAVSATSTTVKETLKAENAATAKSRMKEGINSLFQGLSKALTIPPDDDGQKPVLVVSSESAIYDRSKVRLHAIQVDPGTYLNEPTGPREHFIEWCQHFDMESRKGDVSELLVSKVEVRALYTKLVPAQVSHAEFWQRYFYKLHQMALDEARKQALIKRAERSRTDNNSINDDWSGDEDMEIVELPDIPEGSGSPKKHRYLVEEQTITRLSPEKDIKASVSDKESSKTPSANSIQKDKKILDNLKQKFVTDPAVSKTVENKERASLQSTVETQLHISKGDDLPYENLDSTITKAIKNEPSQNSAESPEFKESKPTAKTSNVPENIKNAQDKEQLLDYSKKADSINIPEEQDQSKFEDKLLDQSYETESSNDKLKVDQSIGQKNDLVKQKSESANTVSESKGSVVEIPAKIPETSVEQVVVQVKPEPINVAPEESKEPVVEIPTKIGQGVVKPEPVSVAPEESVANAATCKVGELKTKEKGDMVVIGSDRESPTSESSGNKDLSNEEDWDKDFDLDVTEEDLKAAEELAKKMGDNLDLEDDDWENWE
ncbi:BSD domain-containing protein 1 isoform X2 [Patella vulgata]|uniref:BSD domain-containing protein 1 isoform X2 n=1 Tax=Patella vulgata TaxID=6465 RepID=UPI0021803A1E|nr:BSD domain-containing protein 1 isoform X2 [Patella vulgata]